MKASCQTTFIGQKTTRASYMQRGCTHAPECGQGMKGVQKGGKVDSELKDKLRRMWGRRIPMICSSTVNSGAD